VFLFKSVEEGVRVTCLLTSFHTRADYVTELKTIIEHKGGHEYPDQVVLFPGFNIVHTHILATG
jgi:hypothetical protein